MELSPEQVQAVNILLSSVQVAQRRGAFSLRDAHTVQGAVDLLVPREEQDRQAEQAAEQAAEESQAEQEEVAEELSAE